MNIDLLICFVNNRSESALQHNQHSMSNYMNGIGGVNMYNTTNGLINGAGGIDEIADVNDRNRHNNHQRHYNSYSHHPYYSHSRPSLSLRRINTTLRSNAGGRFASSSATINGQQHSFIGHSSTPDDLISGGDLAAAAAAVAANSTTGNSLSVREMKYAAFGNFVASSLLDLSKTSALVLVERFTSEIVKALLQKTETTTVSTNTSPEIALTNGVEVDNNNTSQKNST